MALVFMAGCEGCKRTKSRPKPDVSGVEVQVTLLDFQSDFQQYSDSGYETWQNRMRERYGDFYDYFIRYHVIGPRPAHDTNDMTRQAIARYVNDRYVQEVNAQISKLQREYESWREELNQTMRYVRYYFPQHRVPRIILFNSMFTHGVLPVNDSTLAVGLDMFLGSNHPLYDSVGIYQYIRHKLNPRYVPFFTVQMNYRMNYAADDEPMKLIEAITERGKEMYFLSMVFPDAPDSLILGYTARQTEWCYLSERSIWEFMNDKDLLYKTNAMDKTRFLGESPTTSGMPPESPGSIGNFIGWQIVKSFMEKHKGTVNLQQMITNYPAPLIFAKSGYRPQS
ncbi:MAG: hypothetical protein RML37_08590 [Chitinophagales bacterium]|nr:hypothetical protein [Chitinophagales bacterium]